MNAELASIAQTIEFTMLRLANFRARCGGHPRQKKAIDAALRALAAAANQLDRFEAAGSSDAALEAPTSLGDGH